MPYTKIVLGDFGFGEVLDGQMQEWEKLRQQRDLLCFQQLSKDPIGND